MPENKELKELLDTLKNRFETNMNRHPNLKWNDVEQKLEQKPEKCRSLLLMENSGGEPDVVAFEESTEEYIFYDCAPESPKGRRSLCYDKAALDKRKENKPQNNAVDMAKTMGIEMMDEKQYRDLQKLGTFDSKTSSWLKTPEKIRQLGGAIFADFRFDTIFIYHNGAESYYAGRGFRGVLKV